jgi:hypothetical protein
MTATALKESKDSWHRTGPQSRVVIARKTKTIGTKMNGAINTYRQYLTSLDVDAIHNDSPQLRQKLVMSIVEERPERYAMVGRKGY